MTFLRRVIPPAGILRLFLSLGALLGSWLSVPIVEAQSPITVSISVPASPFPQGERVDVQIAVTNCGPNCNPVGVYIDGANVFGTGLQPDGTIVTSGLDTVPVGDHIIQALYYDNASAAYTWSPATPFKVVENHLPKPVATLQIDPAQSIAGSWIPLSMTLSCGSGCGKGGGMLFVDGAYAGFNILDGNGVVHLALAPGGPLSAAGLHRAQLFFFGNATYSNIFSTPVDFIVYPPNTPPPITLSIAVPASPFPQGETVSVTLSSSCSPTCGTVAIFVDGDYVFGTGINPDGTIATAGLAGVPPGDHTIQAVYGDQSKTVVAVSPATKFTVIPNTLPKPDETITINPLSPVTGSSAWISVALSCGTNCGAGGGQLSIDNQYAGFNIVDGNGVAWFYTTFAPPFDAVGQHTISFAYFGNATYSNVFPPPKSFNVSASVSQQYDSGQVTLTVNGVPESVPYNQARNASSGALASALASAINADPNAAISATASGAALNVAAKTAGAATNYAYSVSSTYDTADFAQPSFTAAPANGNLAGGADAATGSGAPQIVYGYSILQADKTSGYAANGNLLAYTDSATGTWTFGYDSLNRLTSGSTSTPIDSGYTSYCWNYDSFGNRLAQTGSNQPMADAAKCAAAPGSNYTVATAAYDASNHMTSFRGVAVPAPDAAGNTTDDGTHQFLYDPEGRICAEGSTAASITSMVQYLYDAEGRRVAKGRITSFSCDSTSNGFQLDKQYLLGPSGEQLTELNGDGSWVHTNVYAAGSMIATFDGKGAHFHLTDWLGTRRAQTDYAGKLEAAYTSLPFGDALASSGAIDPTEHHFTGKERDTESGLDYFGARYYSSNMGRFTSPDDPFVDQSPGDPQSWNLYTYARNNPVVNTDPTGQDCIYGDGNGGGSLLRGDCASDSDNGIFVNGTVDANSFKYNASNNSSSFSYTPDGAGPGTIGTGVIQGPNLNGGFEAGSLAAGVFGAANASKFINAAGVVNGVGGTAMTIGATIVNPALGYVVGCVSGVSGCGVGSAALALLPEVAALRSGAAILRAGRGLNAAEILQKAGGFSQALQDFEALPGKETIMGEMRTKTLLDGTKVTVRDFSKAGPPTLQLNAPSGIKTEYRY